MAEYPPPLDVLLNLGTSPQGTEWLDYRAKGIGPEHISDLIRMATDPALNLGDPDSPEVWVPMHAWRALGQLRAEAAVGPLLGLLRPLDDDEYDDFALSELPQVFEMIGPAALPALEAALQEESRGSYALVSIAEAISSIGTAYREYRDRCVAILTRKLEAAARNDSGLNGFIISDLIDLQAVESAPVIERAFAADGVDVTVAGDWHDVFLALGLEGTPPPSTGWSERQREQFAWLGDLHRAPSERGGQIPVTDHRKARNQARRKQEKKARRQQRKRRR
jgi:hypothetical protein